MTFVSKDESTTINGSMNSSIRRTRPMDTQRGVTVVCRLGTPVGEAGWFDELERSRLRISPKNKRREIVSARGSWRRSHVPLSREASLRLVIDRAAPLASLRKRYGRSML